MVDVNEAINSGRYTSEDPKKAKKKKAEPASVEVDINAMTPEKLIEYASKEFKAVLNIQDGREELLKQVAELQKKKEKPAAKKKK
jgi:hypothetical protein